MPDTPITIGLSSTSSQVLALSRVVAHSAAILGVYLNLPRPGRLGTGW